MVKDKKDEIKIDEPEVKRFTHRYFCEACTGVAFLYAEGDELPKSAKCKSCGKQLTIKKENLIKL